MSERTVRASVTFRRQFALQAVAGRLPPGTYTVETTEERIEGLSFDAHRRIATVIFLPAGSAGADAVQFVLVDPAEFAEAQRLDAQGASGGEPGRCEAKPRSLNRP